MKKTLLSIFAAFALNASAQSVFTVESAGKQYNFPLDATITVTDNKVNLPETPKYKSSIASISLYGTYSIFQMRPMQLIADNLWAGKVMPTGKFKFSAVSATGKDLFYGAAQDVSTIITSGKVVSGGAFFNFEKTFKQDSVMVLFNDKTNEYSILGLTQVKTVDFEGAKWSALIDTKEYGGKLLYGDTGMGWTEDYGVYEWTDDATMLHSKLNNGYGSWAFWSGGAAVSNYHCDIASGSSDTQLSIPTALAAASGSNFLVLNGYSDGSAFGSDSRPVIDFADGKARTIKSLKVTNTSFFLFSLLTGNGFSKPATEKTYINAIFEGFDANGNPTGVVTQNLIQGTKALTDWATVDLTPLGDIVTLKVNYTFSQDQVGEYGFSAPAYIAVDDIEIYD